jgi:hypothetical protein
MGLVMAKVYQVIERIDWEYDNTLGIFTTREKALEYLAGRKKTIYHHVGVLEHDGWMKPYDVWNFFCRNYLMELSSDISCDDIVESLEVGVTETEEGLCYCTPDGAIVDRGTYQFFIEEYELDKGEA